MRFNGVPVAELGPSFQSPSEVLARSVLRWCFHKGSCDLSATCTQSGVLKGLRVPVGTLCTGDRSEDHKNLRKHKETRPVTDAVGSCDQSMAWLCGHLAWGGHLDASHSATQASWCPTPWPHTSLNGPGTQLLLCCHLLFRKHGSTL